MVAGDNPEKEWVVALAPRLAVVQEPVHAVVERNDVTFAIFPAELVHETPTELAVVDVTERAVGAAANVVRVWHAESAELPPGDQAASAIEYWVALVRPEIAADVTTPSDGVAASWVPEQDDPAQ